MKLLLDFEILKEHGLEPQQYVWLYLQHQNEVEESWRVSPINEADLVYLQHHDYIKITSTGEQPTVMLRANALNLFEVSEPEKKFEELWCTYPMVVTDERGNK